MEPSRPCAVEAVASFVFLSTSLNSFGALLSSKRSVTHWLAALPNSELAVEDLIAIAKALKSPHSSCSILVSQ